MMGKLKEIGWIILGVVFAALVILAVIFVYDGLCNGVDSAPC